MKKIAKLAMLGENDAEKFKEDIEKMKKMAEALNELDVTKELLFGEGRMRDDMPEESFKREEILKNAPEVEDGHVLVPKTVGE